MSTQPSPAQKQPLASSKKPKPKSKGQEEEKDQYPHPKHSLQNSINIQSTPLHDTCFQGIILPRHSSKSSLVFSVYQSSYLCCSGCLHLLSVAVISFDRKVSAVVTLLKRGLSQQIHTSLHKSPAQQQIKWECTISHQASSKTWFGVLGSTTRQYKLGPSSTNHKVTYGIW